MVAEVEEWLREFTYDYRIVKVEQFVEGNYRVNFLEYGSNGESTEEMFTVYQNGQIINSNGDDVVEVGLSGCDYYDEYVGWLIDFKKKWRRD